MGLGFAISMGLHPYISDFLISNYGWRMAWVITRFIYMVNHVTTINFLSNR